MISKLVISVFVLLVSVHISSGTSCVLLRNDTGGVNEWKEVKRDEPISECFDIVVSNEATKYVRIEKLKPLESDSTYVKTSITGIGDNFVYNMRRNTEARTINIPGSARINFFARIDHSYRNVGNYGYRFNYTIEDIVCTKKGSLRCSVSSCVKQSQICDGIRDCENGNDEQNCESNIETIKNIDTNRNGAISWMKKEKLGPGPWQKTDQRTVTAIYLADGVADEDEDESMVKKLELEASVALLRNGKDRVTTNELAFYIQALLVTCHNPRKFYDFDLVKLLKDREMESHRGGGHHPIAILALCNANETVTNRQLKELVKILNFDSTHPYILEVQAIALMALSCIKNSGFHQHYVNAHINSTAVRFMELQKPDGSYGSIYTTALLTQALLSIRDEAVRWQYVLAAKYLMKQQASDSSFGDFLATYFILPVLNGKNLADIGETDCSENRKKVTDGTSDIEYKLKHKMNVTYSIYIGDELDAVDSIVLRIPVNLTAYQVMEIASETYPKYKFESYMDDEKVYVFAISGIANDPESGKFWLFYLGHSKQRKNSKLITESPDKIAIHDGDHIIMWYKYPSLSK